MPTLSQLEQRYVESVLTSTGGNKAQAARILGLDRRTLYRKLDRFARQQESS
jgi:two-component system response regulator HydG